MGLFEQDKQLGTADFATDRKVFDIGLHAFRTIVVESDKLKDFITRTLLGMVAKERGNEVINMYVRQGAPRRSRLAETEQWLAMHVV